MKSRKNQCQGMAKNSGMNADRLKRNNSTKSVQKERITIIDEEKMETKSTRNIRKSKAPMDMGET